MINIKIWLHLSSVRRAAWLLYSLRLIMLCWQKSYWFGFLQITSTQHRPKSCSTGTRTHACLAVSQLLSNQVAGSQIPAIGSCLKSFSTTGAATGNRTRVSRLHVQRADHYTMAEEWGLQDTHPLWRSKSSGEHCNSGCNLWLQYRLQAHRAGFRVTDHMHDSVVL